MNADALVLFGATGDLAKKKLFPALYDLEELGQLGVPVFGVASSKWSQDVFKENAESAIRTKKSDLDEKVLRNLLDELTLVVGDYDDPNTFQKLSDAISQYKLPVIYLAIAPENFEKICQGLAAVGITKRARVVVEKPFGRDLASAIALDESLKKILPEEQIYRIDHYLGKESVEDLLVFRFANTLFEPVWNRNYISNIQITMSENFGIDGRGKFYDGVGATRDVLQNHLLQVLTMLTMEPPIDTTSESMQNEKIKVMSAIRAIEPADVVRGQFVGYLEEEGVAEHSDTETFVAMKMFIDNWRWAGVPFYLRTGKRMATRSAEITINFKPIPYSIFGNGQGPMRSNRLVISLQPEESVKLFMKAKEPGEGIRLSEVALDLDFAEVSTSRRVESYERLLLDAMRGDLTLFVRDDELMAAWNWVDPILQAWQNDSEGLKSYIAGSWGPVAASYLLAQHGAAWGEEYVEG